MERLVLVLVLLTGCSVALVRGPRTSAPDQDPACTRSPIGPALDVILAGVSGGVALVFQQRHEDWLRVAVALPARVQRLLAAGRLPVEFRDAFVALAIRKLHEGNLHEL